MLKCRRVLKDPGQCSMLAYSSWSTRFTSVLFCAAAVHQRRWIRTAKSKMPQILCVAEKPSISKAVAGHLSGGQLQTVCILASAARTDYHADISLA